MPNYIRTKAQGGTYFFTVVTTQRQPILTHPDVLAALRAAIKTTQITHPFTIEAWVVLPDHMHSIWTLPADDAQYSIRWSMIKRYVAKECRHLALPQTASQQKRREIAFWQRRFWEHQIRDQADYQRHMDYVHINPVKHQCVSQPKDWPYSTFHRLVKSGVYSEDWAENTEFSDDFGE